MFLLSCLHRGASRARAIAAPRVVSRLTTGNVQTRHGDVCGSVRALYSCNCSVVQARNTRTNCHVTSHAFRLPRIGLLISLMRSSGFVAAGGSQRLVNGLRRLIDGGSTGGLRHRIIITSHGGADGRGVCCDISIVRSTVTRGQRVHFRCFS